MDFKTRLLAIQESIKPILVLQQNRLDELDWDVELDTMLENDEYTIVDKSFLPKEYSSFVTLVRGTLNSDTTELRDLLLDTEAKVSSVLTLQRNRLKEEFFKRDLDLMPNLLCHTCGYFFNTQSGCNEHNCKGSTTCHLCKQDCKTKDRLEAHIRARKCIKKYKCDKCPDFKPTNSEDVWQRHLESKKHKGTDKKQFVCEVCNNKPFRFLSDYERHLVSVKHKKLCSS